MTNLVRKAAPLVAFGLTIWIGHAAVVDHQTTILAIIVLIAAFALATLVLYLWPAE
jgi:uncharacterized membrane protein